MTLLDRPTGVKLSASVLGDLFADCDAPTAAPAPRALAAGAAVLVAWSDGDRYRGTVQSMSEGQVHVAFADGAAHWIPTGFVTLA